MSRLQLKIAACQVFRGHCNQGVDPPVPLWPVGWLTLLGLLAKFPSKPSLFLCCNCLRPGSVGKGQGDRSWTSPWRHISYFALPPGQLSHFLLPLHVTAPTGWWVGGLGLVVSQL